MAKSWLISSNSPIRRLFFIYFAEYTVPVVLIYKDNLQFHWGGGDNLQFHPNFNIGGMKHDHNSFLVSKSSEDQKKKTFSRKIEEFLSPKASEDQKKSPKIIQGSDADHSQIIGGIYLPPPPGFGTPV